MSGAETQPEAHIIVVGVGLIGGSIAAAARAANPDCRVTGVGRNEKRLAAAKRASLIDDFVTDTEQLELDGRAIVIVCLPVELISATVRDIASQAGPEIVITDAGSVKEMICRQLIGDATALARFVGAHPIAGGEKTGFEAASGSLFQDRCCIVTTDGASTSNISRVAAFWRSLGCDVRQMDAQQHDRVVALTSHLPHLMAVGTTQAQSNDTLPFTGTGFRDSTRVAAGDAELWTQILLGNRDSVLQAVTTARRCLDELSEAIDANDRESLRRLLDEAATLRGQLDQP